MGKVSFKALFFAIILGLVGLVGAYNLTMAVSARLINQEFIKLENVAKQISIHFQDAIDKSTNDLAALQAFYSAKPELSSQSEFNQYMDVLSIEQRHYIQALSWVPLVHDDNRDEFEARLRRQQGDFLIKARDEKGVLAASQRKATYTPVTYIRPYLINKAAQGFDLSSSATRNASLIMARNTGLMTATSKIRLVQETGESYGFLIIAPVFAKGSLPKTAEERRLSLVGYVTGVFRIDTLMNNAREQADKIGLKITLHDIETDEISLLYGQTQPDSAFSFDIKIPDRHWQLNLSLNDELKQKIESPSIANWILVGGGLISFLLALSFYALQVAVMKSRRVTNLSELLQVQNRELEETVAERTLALSEQNTLLNQHVKSLEQQKTSLSLLMQESETAKQSAQNLAQELARSNRDLDDFAYVASHDLKAPLRGISQLSNWVLEDIEEGKLEDIPKNLTLINNRVKRLDTLLSDLLEYSRANRQQATLALLDSQELIQGLFPLYSPNDKFELELISSLPVFETLKSPFEQVVRNLLNNAFKHHDKSAGKIQISCEEIDDYYTFMIKDDGPGIEADYFKEIFKMFKTLKPRDEVEGSGMGLALIKKIVEHYGGQVYLESKVGKGSAFYFTWPKLIKN